MQATKIHIFLKAQQKAKKKNKFCKLEALLHWVVQVQGLVADHTNGLNPQVVLHPVLNPLLVQSLRGLVQNESQCQFVLARAAKELDHSAAACFGFPEVLAGKAPSFLHPVLGTHSQGLTELRPNKMQVASELSAHAHRPTCNYS